MCDSAQAGFDAAQYDWTGIFEEAPDQVRVGDGCPVGSLVVHTAGGVIVALAAFFQCGMVCHHRVDAAGGDAPEQTRFAQTGDIRLGLSVWLGDDTHLVACLQQQLANQRSPDERAVDVAVAADQDNIQVIPA